MSRHIFQTMLQHCGDDRQRIWVKNFALAESLQKAEEVKVSVKVDLGDVVTEQNTETDRPECGHIPKSLQSV
jgi:hypothetical protein